MRPDVEEFFCGISFDAYRLLGSPPGGARARLAVYLLWAPHARRVQLLGTGTAGISIPPPSSPFVRTACGAGGCPRRSLGSCTNYNIQGPDGSWQLRADPFAFAFEALPGTVPAWRSRITRSPLPCCAVPAGMLPF